MNGDAGAYEPAWTRVSRVHGMECDVAGCGQCLQGCAVMVNGTYRGGYLWLHDAVSAMSLGHPPRIHWYDGWLSATPMTGWCTAVWSAPLGDGRCP